MGTTLTTCEKIGTPNITYFRMSTKSVPKARKKVNDYYPIIGAEKGRCITSITISICLLVKIQYIMYFLLDFHNFDYLFDKCQATTAYIKIIL